MNVPSILPGRAHDRVATLPASRRALLNWSLELIVGVVLAYLLVIGLSPNVLWPTTFSAITVGLILILTLVWAWDRSRTLPAQLGWTHTGGLLWIAAGAVTAFSSIEPTRSWNAWGQGLALLAVFLMLADLTAGKRQGRAVNVLLWAGALAMLWTWAQAAGWYVNWLTLNPQQWLPTIPYRLPNPNQVSLLLALLLTPAGLRLWAGKGADRWWMAIFLLSDAALLFLTSSRGGWMGAAAGVIVAVIALVRPADIQRGWGRARQAVRARPWILAAGAALAMLGVAAVGLALWNQLDQPTRGGRLEYWIPAWQTFAARPALGQGQATFAISYLQTHTAPPGVVYNHAHSLYFNTLAEGGLAGLLAGGILLSTFLVALWKRRTSSDPAARVSFALGCATLAVYLTHGLVDNVAFDKGNVLVLILLLAGTVDVVDSAQSSLFGSWRMILTALLATATMIAGVYSLWRDEPLQQGIARAGVGDWSGAADRFADAIAREPASPAAWQQLGLAEARLAEAGSSIALAQAIDALGRASALDPSWPANALNLGALYRAQGDLAAARTWLQRAADAAPLVPLYHINLGRVLEELGDAPGARSAYEQALSLAPEQALSPYWEETDLRRGVRAAWAQAHPAQSDPYASIDPSSGLSDAALARAERALDSGDWPMAEYWLGIADLGYWARSDSRLRWAWRLAELRAERGDFAGAVELAGRLRGLLDEPSSFGAGTGGGSVFGTYVAVRPTLESEMVPQVLDLAPTIDWPERLATARSWCARLAPTAGDAPTPCPLDSTP